MLNAQCSMLNAQCSMLNAQCSMLNAQCSMLNAQCSMLNAQCSMATDPNYKRIMYVRYADDFIILIAESKNDAELIKNWVKSAL